MGIVRATFRKHGHFAAMMALVLWCSTLALAQARLDDPCRVVSVGSPIESPSELRSRDGLLQVTLSLRRSVDSQGRTQFCYVDQHGHRSPTLRVRPGDMLILNLKNEIVAPSGTSSPRLHTSSHSQGCSVGGMTPDGTNLHFHGLSIPPTCHADDSLHTSVASSPKPFIYRFRIPKDQPPGLYWYHPHPHGHSEEQVLGGASGALIVEGIASANPNVSGLPERVLVIRDQQLTFGVPANASHDPTVPAKDLSLNFVSVPYPEYPVGTIETASEKRELWRVLNASADTYVNLGILLNGEWKDAGLTAVHGSWQKLGLVAVDGVPISGNPGTDILWRTEIPIPPGGRAEFLVQTPPAGAHATLFTAGAEINPPDDEDNPGPTIRQPGAVPDRDDFTPPRPLARIVSSADTREPPALAESKLASVQTHRAALTAVQPVRQRKLYFSEKVIDPKHPEMSTVFYLTEEGHIPKAFDPSNLAPDITVHQGDIEDWTIENRSMESHSFHIHQVHFLLLERNGAPAADSYLADTVDVPYWDGNAGEYPSVKLRMDFRNPEIVGTFPYHCHILQHSDAGMMGLIQVLPRELKGKKIPPNNRRVR